MTRQTVIAIVVGVIIVLGASAAFLYSKTQKTDKPTAATTTQNESTAKEKVAMSSITDLLNQGKNTKCTFTSTSENGETSGTVYVTGDKARGDFDVTLDGEKTTTHMIRQGDTFYMWGDSLPTGMKMVMSIKEWAQKAEAPQPTGTVSTFDPNSQVDFKCGTWTVDSGLFNAPTNVKFITIEGMMGPTGAMTDDKTTSDATKETDTQSQCSICSALTGDARDVCLKQFNCQ